MGIEPQDHSSYAPFRGMRVIRSIHPEPTPPNHPRSWVQFPLVLVHVTEKLPIGSFEFYYGTEDGN